MPPLGLLVVGGLLAKRSTPSSMVKSAASTPPSDHLTEAPSGSRRRVRRNSARPLLRVANRIVAGYLRRFVHVGDLDGHGDGGDAPKGSVAVTVTM